MIIRVPLRLEVTPWLHSTQLLHALVRTVVSVRNVVDGPRPHQRKRQDANKSSSGCQRIADYTPLPSSVTTVAALGWVSSKEVLHFRPSWTRPWCIWCFAFSILFAILTLAMVSHVAELLKTDTSSIYAVYWDGWGPSVGLLSFCLPQHIFFLFGNNALCGWPDTPWRVTVQAILY